MTEQVQRSDYFASPGMTMAQVARCTLIGIAVWFAGALLIAWLAPMGGFELHNLWLTYVLLIPGTLPTVYLMRWAGGLRSDQAAMGMAVGTAAAIMLDGVALRWFPSLYGAGADTAGATILWGGGVGLLLGLILNKAPQS